MTAKLDFRRLLVSLCGTHSAQRAPFGVGSRLLALVAGDNKALDSACKLVPLVSGGLCEGATMLPRPLFGVEDTYELLSHNELLKEQRPRREGANVCRGADSRAHALTQSDQSLSRSLTNNLAAAILQEALAPTTH